MANVAKALEHDLWMSCKPGAILPIHPGNFIPIGRRPSITFDEYLDKSMYYMYGARGTREPKQHKLETPSMFWECAGVYTVYILSCVLVYLLV